MSSVPSGNTVKTGILGNLAMFLYDRKRKSAYDALVIHTVEQVVDSIDPRMRSIARYAWKIRPAVERMLNYAGEACSNLPGPIEFSRDAWGTDPCVRALFATATELQAVFSRSPEVADYFASTASADAYVVLGMQKTEKTVFGAEMYGDILRRDMPKISVSFSDHRISHPAPDERELRVRLRARALNEFIAQALFKVAELTNQKEGIRKRKVALQVQLKALESRLAGLPELFEIDSELRKKIATTRQELERVEQECSTMRDKFGTLSDVLRNVVEMLSEPEALIRVTPVTLFLDRMNHLIEPRDSDRERAIALAQVNFGERFSRMGILAKFPRGDFVPGANQMDLDAALRFLG